MHLLRYIEQVADTCGDFFIRSDWDSYQLAIICCHCCCYHNDNAFFQALCLGKCSLCQTSLKLKHLANKRRSFGPVSSVLLARTVQWQHCLSAVHCGSALSDADDSLCSWTKVSQMESVCFPSRLFVLQQRSQSSSHDDVNLGPSANPQSVTLIGISADKHLSEWGFAH